MRISIGEHRCSVQPLYSSSIVRSEDASACLGKDRSSLAAQDLPLLFGNLCRHRSSPFVALRAP